MTDYPTKRNRTIYGMPSFVPDAHEPFQLFPYVACGDSHTPSHEVNRAEPTEPHPYLPRPRVFTPEERIVIRELDRCRRMPKPAMEPSTLAKAVACVIVCYAIAFIVGATLF